MRWGLWWLDFRRHSWSRQWLSIRTGLRITTSWWITRSRLKQTRGADPFAFRMVPSKWFESSRVTSRWPWPSFAKLASRFMDCHLDSCVPYTTTGANDYSSAPTCQGGHLEMMNVGEHWVYCVLGNNAKQSWLQSATRSVALSWKTQGSYTEEEMLGKVQLDTYGHRG